MKTTPLLLIVCYSLSLIAAPKPEKLSDITRDEALMWGFLKSMKGERIIKPAGAPKKIKVFPRKLPSEILEKILCEVHEDTLKHSPRKNRKELRLDYPMFSPDLYPHFDQEWLPDSNEVLIHHYPSVGHDERHDVTVNVDEGTYTIHESPVDLYPRNNKRVYRALGANTQEVIDQLTYNRLRQLHENNNSELAWLTNTFMSNRNWYPDFLNRDKTKYAVITHLNKDTYDSQQILRIQSVHRDEPLITFPASKYRYMFDWSPQDAFAVLKKRAEGHWDFSLEVYDTTQQPPVLSFSIPIPEYNERQERISSFRDFFCFSFSPKGNFLALQTYYWQDDRRTKPEIKIFDAKTGELFFSFNNYTSSTLGGQIALQKAWSPDESRIILRQEKKPLQAIFSLNDKRTLLKFFQSKATPLQHSLLFALMKFNFTQEDFDYIKSKFRNNDIFKLLEHFLDLKVARIHKRTFDEVE